MRKTTVDALRLMTSLLVVIGLLILPLGLAVAGPPDGKALYSSKCAMCHGSDGTAREMWAKKGAKNLNDPAWQKETTDDAIAQAIRDGFPSKQMPSYKDKLKPEEVTALVKHVRTLAPSKK